MLKTTINFDVFLILINSIIMMLFIINSKNNYKKIRIILFIFMIQSIISCIVYESGIVDFEWDILRLRFISIITFIIHIISLAKINKKIKKEKDNNKKDKGIYILLTLILIPILIFIIPYFKELNILNNAEIKFHYNYQDGIITSNDYYYVFSNNKYQEITLNKFKEGTNIYYVKYEINYEDSTKIFLDDNEVFNNDILEIANDAKERFESTKGDIYYYVEGKYAIVSLYNSKTDNYIDYFYSDNKYIQKISTPGDLMGARYYK